MHVNLKAFDARAGFRGIVASGLVLVLGLVFGRPAVIAALSVVFISIIDSPGPLRERLSSGGIYAAPLRRHIGRLGVWGERVACGDLNLPRNACVRASVGLWSGASDAGITSELLANCNVSHGRFNHPWAVRA